MSRNDSPPIRLSSASDPASGGDYFVFPVSFAQRRIWFAEKLQPCGSFFNVACGFRGSPAFDHGMMERVFNEIVNRHESLRTRFAESDGEPQQIIERELQVRIPVADLSALSEERAQVEADRLIHESCVTPFDISHIPLCRALLVRLPGDAMLLLLVMHHIIFDGWSQGIFLEEAAVLHDAFKNGFPSPLPQLPVQYADYTIWKREQLSSAKLKGQLEYWKAQLAGIKSVQIPGGRPRTAMVSGPAGFVDFFLDADLRASLKVLGQRESATLFMVLLAGFQSLLFRTTGQFDISVASTVAGRNRPETRGLIGCFTNTLVLRNQFFDNPTFLQILQQARKTTIEAYDNQDVPFEVVADAIQPNRDPGDVPLYRVGFVMHNLPTPRLQMKGTHLEYLAFDSDIARVDLSVALSEDENGVRGKAKYHKDVFEESAITTLFRRFDSLLRSGADDPHEYVSRLALGH